MLNHRTLIAALMFFLTFILDASAESYFCSRKLSGVTSRIVEINRYRILDGVEPRTVGLPNQFRIDFESKELIPAKGSRVSRTVSFKTVAQMEDKLVIQGVDEGVAGVRDGVAWSLIISKNNGESVLAVAGDGVAYAVFGVCKPTPDPNQ